jgi:hypothetical protein
MDEVVTEIRQECRDLAREMVRLEEWAREAYDKHRFVRVGELHSQREDVQAHRSELMREVWHARY